MVEQALEDLSSALDKLDQVLESNADINITKIYQLESHIDDLENFIASIYTSN